MKGKTTSLGNFVEVNPESVTKAYSHDEILYIDISSVASGYFVESPKLLSIKDAPSRAKRIVRDGDTMLATVRPNLRSFLFVKDPESNTIASTGFAVLRAKENVDPRFVYYAVTDKRFTGYLTNNTRGTSYPAVDTDTVLRGEIPDYDLLRQRRIVSILSVYDDLIENNRRRIQLLEQAARLLYKEWFVHFRFPGHEHVTITDGVPEGWEKDTVGGQSTLIRGKSYNSSELVESGGKLFVNLKCVARHGGFRVDGLKRFSGKHRNDQVVFPGDIVIAVTDMTRERHIVAHPARVPKVIGEEAVFSMDTVKIIPGSTIDKIWFYYFLRYSVFSKKVREYATGTNVLHLKPKQIEGYEFHYPPRLIQERFGVMVSGILTQQDNLMIQNEKLANVRDLLLPRLMNGGVTI